MNYIFSFSLAFLRRLSLVSILCGCSLVAWAQTAINQNRAFWLEANIGGKIKGKFSYQLDYQFRRQGESDKVKLLRGNQSTTGSHSESSSLFTYPYQQVVRPWVHYQLSSKLRLSLSPLGWWGTWSPNASGGLNFQPEFRVTAQLTYTKPVGRVSFTSRTRYEFRFFGLDLPTDSPDNPYTGLTSYHTRKARFRHMARVLVPLNRAKMETGTIYANIYDEVFIGIGHNTKPERVFDQNRAFLGLGYKFSPAFRLEAGYLNQIIPRGHVGTTRNVDINHVLSMFIIVDDLGSLLKKKAQ
jgi:hypothetical protein